MRDIIIAKEYNYSPITLFGIVKSDDTNVTTTVLPVTFMIVLPYDTEISRELELVIACGKYISVNFILGKLFLENSQTLLFFETNILRVPVFHYNNNEPFNG